MNELLSDPLLPSEESPRPAGIKGVAKQVNHDGQAASKRRLSMLRGLKEKDEKSALIKQTKDAKKESKKESKSVAAAAAEKESKKESKESKKEIKKEIKEESTKESKKESKSVSAASAAEPEVVVLTESQQAHAAKKASKEAAAAAKDDVKDDAKDATSKKTSASVSDSSSSKSSKASSSKASSSSSSKKEVLPEGVDVPKMGTTLLPPKIGTNKIKASNIIMHQVRRVKKRPALKPTPLMLLSILHYITLHHINTPLVTIILTVPSSPSFPLPLPPPGVFGQIHSQGKEVPLHRHHHHLRLLPYDRQGLRQRDQG